MTTELSFIEDTLFPHFRKLTINDLLAYSDFYSRHLAPYADISPANLYSWLDIDGTLEISGIDGGLILKYANPFAHNSTSFLVLKPQIATDDLQRLVEYQRDNKYNLGLREQPIATVSSIIHDFPQNGFTVVPNRDSWEYILDVKAHAELIGREYDSRKRGIQWFEHEHSHEKIDLEYFSHPNDELKNRLYEAISLWQLTAKESETFDDTNREFEALVYAIGTLDTFNRHCIVLTLDSRIFGFGIFAIFDDTAIAGHLKVDYSLRRVFDYATYRLALVLNDLGIPYLNVEQDLGISNLRKHKQLMRPIRMLEKVDVIPLSDS